MNKYQRYIIKDIKKLSLKLLAIVLIVMLGVAFLVGLLTTAPNMRYSMERYYNVYQTADLVIQSDAVFSDEAIHSLRLRDEIDEVMPYLLVDEHIEINQNSHVARIMLLDFHGGISLNQLSLVEGRFPSLDSNHIEVVVEKSQTYLIDIPIGYQTTLLGETFEVVGIVQNPWYFAYVQEISPLSQRPIEAMIYADQSFMNEMTYSHLAVTIAGAKNYDMFSNAYKTFIDQHVEQLSQDYSAYYFTTRNQNQSFVKYQSDIKIVEAIALIFPLFFFLITILVSMSSMTRIISDQRIQIGTFRSLGYSKFKIMWKYIFYALLASGMGTILGIGLGIYFIPAIIYNAYLTSYNLPTLSIEYHFLYISSISLIMIISVVCVTMMSVGSALREKPAELLKIKAPKPGSKIFLERIPFIWNRLKFRYKSTFRNIFRHKRNLILMLVGIAGSTALLLAGFGIKDSVDFAGLHQYEEMMNYDLEIAVNANETNITAIDSFHQIIVMTDLAKYENNDYISILIPEDESRLNDFMHFKDINRNDVMMTQNSVMVTHQFAIKHNIKEGDSITLDIRNIQSDFIVTDIINYYFGNYIYLAGSLIGSEYDIEYNRIYVQTHLDLEEQTALRDQLKDDANVVHVLFESEIKYAFQQTSQSMTSIIVVLVLSASALAIIINYNLTLINISTRQKEIATLKVLGYHEVEVSGYVFRETVMISTVAILIGLGFGRTLHYFIISRVVLDGIMLSNQIGWLSYLLTLILSFAFLGIVYAASIPKMRKIDMIDALKSYE